MSPHTIHHSAPLGSIIAFADGSPRPPYRSTKDLAVWGLFNGEGLLVRKEPTCPFAPNLHLASITLRTAEFGSPGPNGLTIALNRPGGKRFTLKIAKLPPIGSVRILRGRGDDVELLHLAEDDHAAAEWLARHSIEGVWSETVCADELAAGVIEGRLEPITAHH